MEMLEKFLEVTTDIGVKLKPNHNFEKQEELAKVPYTDESLMSLSFEEAWKVFMKHPRIFKTIDEKVNTALIVLSKKPEVTAEEKLSNAIGMLIELIFCFNSRYGSRRIIIEKIVAMNNFFDMGLLNRIANIKDFRWKVEISSLHADTYK